MRVKLLRDVKPFGRTGETVEVSPEHCEWLTSLGMAEEPVEEAREQAEKPEPKVLKKPEKKAAKEEPKIVKTAKPAAKKK